MSVENLEGGIWLYIVNFQISMKITHQIRLSVRKCLNQKMILVKCKIWLLPSF